MIFNRCFIFVLLFNFCYSLFGNDLYLPLDTTIHIDAISGLQFDVVRFKVPPNTRIGIIFYNDDDMPHNLVITKPGTRLEVLKKIENMILEGNTDSYVPDFEDILWSINTLNPYESKRLYFVTPSEEGIYPYVCTLPGHGYIMYGAMYVTTSDLPEIELDENIPEIRRKNIGISSHEKKYPYNNIYRIFMPNASSASIAVNVSDNLSYCWDGTTCNLRYLWKGGFIDNTEIWHGHRNGVAKILGDIFYENEMDFSLFTDFLYNTPTVRFIGYNLINQLPEFQYILNDVTIKEFYYLNNDSGFENLNRKFSTNNLKRRLFFKLNEKDMFKEGSENVFVERDYIKILPKEGDTNFTIEIQQ